MTPFSARRHVWLRPGEPLCCPRGHKLKHNAAVLQHEAFICQHKGGRGESECNSRCYVLAMPGGLRFVAEVTVKEMLTMRDACMTVADVLNYLQCSPAA